MRHETISIQEEGSLQDTRLVTYLLDSSEELAIKKRPLLLICPGGGYRHTSDREAESVALAFLAMGYHAAILRYSCAPAQFPTPVLEVARAVAIVREHAVEWQVETNQIYVLGFSAGGHLAGLYATIWTEQFVAETIGVEKEVLRPNGLILGYPVISSTEYVHEQSIHNLLGDRFEELRETVSLEKRVNAEVPRTFVWHTYTDDEVLVENSLLFVNALRKHHIETEFHMYAKGGHGLSLANEITKSELGVGIQKECETWMLLVRNWLPAF